MDKLQENVTDTGCEKDECEKENKQERATLQPVCCVRLAALCLLVMDGLQPSQASQV